MMVICFFRHIYTKRIIEIIGNVDKQNAEIKKILEDTRQLQKEINTLEGQLERCFAIADETLFKVSLLFIYVLLKYKQKRTNLTNSRNDQ